VKKRYDDFERFLKKQLKRDPEFKAEYKRLEPVYSLIEDEIRLRLSKKMTQKELAREMNTSQSAISRFEAGNIMPSMRFINKLARALDTEIEIKFKQRCSVVKEVHPQ
jgi:ribosome-binding protein aMBF1 (putative translation factor)